MDQYIGEIRSFGFNFQPRGWFFCDGRLLPIQSYTPLFAILGTTYGGNGQTNFALPDLRGRLAMHWGNNANADTVLGEELGTATVTLNPTEIPLHTHLGYIATGAGTQRGAIPTPTSYLSAPSGDAAYQAAPVTANALFSPKAISVAGGNAAHNNQQPYLALNFCIAYQGSFPPHS